MICRYNGKSTPNATNYVRLLKNKLYFEDKNPVVLRRFDWYTTIDVSKDCIVTIFKVLGLTERKDGRTSHCLPQHR
jgi:hypothetical protein